MQPNVFVNARIPTQLAAQLKTQAAQNDRTVSAELRRAIAAHVTGEVPYEHRATANGEPDGR